MRTLSRVAFIGLIVGIVGAIATIGWSNATISFTDCATPQPTPTSTPSPKPSGSPPAPTPIATPQPTPQRTPPPNNCTPKPGTAIWGTQTLAFSVRPDGVHPVKEVKVEVKAYQDSGAADAASPLFDHTYNAPDPSTCGSAPTGFTVPWDTVAVSPRNGHYQVIVTAATYGPACNGNDVTSQAPATNILVDNAPDPVGAPRIIATTASTVSLQWDASTAPDVTRYEVYRAATTSTKNKPAAKDFALWLYTTGTSFRDPQVSPGIYWYAIMVTRRSVVTPDTGISSQLSDPSKPVTILAPTPGPTSSPGPNFQRYIPLNRLLLPPSQNGALAPVPDAPYSAQLPYGNVPEEGSNGTASAGGTNSGEGGVTDPRGPVLPVAVGAFLVSAALALGRMPY